MDRIRQCIEFSISSVSTFTSAMNGITRDADNFIKELFYQIISKNDIKNSQSHHIESNSNYSIISNMVYEKWKSINRTISCIFRRNKKEKFNNWCQVLVEYDTKENKL